MCGTWALGCAVCGTLGSRVRVVVTHLVGHTLSPLVGHTLVTPRHTAGYPPDMPVCCYCWQVRQMLRCAGSWCFVYAYESRPDSARCAMCVPQTTYINSSHTSTILHHCFFCKKWSIQLASA